MGRPHLSVRHPSNVAGEGDRLLERLRRRERIIDLRHKLRSATGGDRADYREELDALLEEEQEDK